MSAPPSTPRPYQDRDLPVERRVADLTGRMSLEEKAGLCFHTMLLPGPGGSLNEEHVEAFDIDPTTTLVTAAHITHFNLFGTHPVRDIAVWNNNLQDLAADTRWAIPVTVSSDPRNAFTANPGTGAAAGGFSQWPETTGLAAIGDEDVVAEYAATLRQEYLAVGLRVALHPQIDLATEPRWARTNATFGQDADLSARLVVPYIRGLQGEALGVGSVAAMAKHFPGGGPQKDGEDPHFAYGREQVYPGDQFDYHLKPFRAAIAAKASQIMPYYGMPVGTPYEEVGFGFNKGIITDLLRGELGFDGIVVADWRLITDGTALGDPFPARAWGVEHLSPAERMAKAFHAGVDQFGGEACVDVLIELVRDGTISEARLDESVRRLLREKFVLGLFDDPYVDVEAAEALVGTDAAVAAGRTAQSAALTVLKNDTGASGSALLPLPATTRLYVEGVDPTVAAGYASVVDSPDQADVAVVRLSTPYEPRFVGLERFFHAGRLNFTETELQPLLQLASSVPTVVDIYLDRAAVIPELAEASTALVANFGASDHALLDVLFGRVRPRGRLPFDLPSSMEEVECQRPDVPGDTTHPLYRRGDGLDLPPGRTRPAPKTEPVTPR